MEVINSSAEKAEPGTLEWLYNCAVYVSRSWPINKEINNGSILALDMPGVDGSKERGTHRYDL